MERETTSRCPKDYSNFIKHRSSGQKIKAFFPRNTWLMLLLLLTVGLSWSECINITLCWQIGDHSGEPCSCPCFWPCILYTNLPVGAVIHRGVNPHWLFSTSSLNLPSTIEARRKKWSDEYFPCH